MTDQLQLLGYAKSLERYVRLLPAMRQLGSLPREQQTLLRQLRDNAAVSRKAVSDILIGDDVTFQLESAAIATEALEHFHAQLLEASNYDLAGPADVAQLSAIAQTIKDAIRA